MGKDPDILVDLTTARTAFEAEMIAEALRAQGIPAEAFTIVGSTLQWDIAATQPMRIQVRRRDLERAGEILRAIRAESVDIDWSEVDTGDETPEDASENRSLCRECGYDTTDLPLGNRCPECGAGAQGRVLEERHRSRVWSIARTMLVYAACVMILEPLSFGFAWVTSVVGGWPSWSWPYGSIHLTAWVVAGVATWWLLRAGPTRRAGSAERPRT